MAAAVINGASLAEIGAMHRSNGSFAAGLVTGALKRLAEHYADQESIH